MKKYDSLEIHNKARSYSDKKDMPDGYILSSLHGKVEMHKSEDLIIMIDDKQYVLGLYLNSLKKELNDTKHLVKLATEKLIKIEKELKGNGTIK